VVETALELSGQPPLTRKTLNDPNGEKPSIEVFTVPALRGSWAACKEGLEHPFTHLDRPIVFDNDAASGRDDVVLAHLNHRLVAMSLRLLRAEVWSPDSQRKLYRVTARVVPNVVLDTPAVIAHGRLLLLGGDNQRLHEELIFAGGYLRQGRFARMNVGQVQHVLEAARTDMVSPQMQQHLQELWPTHSESLLQALEARLRERTNGLQKFLAERAEKEMSDITTILTELRNTILAELRQPEVEQLQLAALRAGKRAGDAARGACRGPGVDTRTAGIYAGTRRNAAPGYGTDLS